MIGRNVEKFLSEWELELDADQLTELMVYANNVEKAAKDLRDELVNASKTTGEHAHQRIPSTLGVGNGGNTLYQLQEARSLIASARIHIKFVMDERYGSNDTEEQT